MCSWSRHPAAVALGNRAEAHLQRLRRLAARLSVLALLACSISVQGQATATAPALADDIVRAQAQMRDGRLDQAYQTIVPLADAGDPAALHVLGRLHLRPKFSAFAPHEAARLLEAAAKAGYAPSQHDLAELYRRGLGTKQDTLAAFRWHLRAARQQYRLSEAAIAEMYRKGEGVARSPDQADRWRARSLRARASAPTPAPASPTATASAPKLIASGMTARTQQPIPADLQTTRIQPASRANTAPAATPLVSAVPQTRSEKPTTRAGGTGATSKRKRRATYVLQFGAFRSSKGATRRLQSLQTKLLDQGVRFALTTHPATVDGAPMYQVRGPGKRNLKATAALCQQLKRQVQGLDCFARRAD